MAFAVLTIGDPPPYCSQGIEGHGFYGSLVVPIIENTARECELTDRLRQAIKDYPGTNAVLVRRHGEDGARGGGEGEAQARHGEMRGAGRSAQACMVRGGKGISLCAVPSEEERNW